MKKNYSTTDLAEKFKPGKLYKIERPLVNVRDLNDNPLKIYKGSVVLCVCKPEIYGSTLSKVARIKFLFEGKIYTRDTGFRFHELFVELC